MSLFVPLCCVGILAYAQTGKSEKTAPKDTIVVIEQEKKARQPVVSPLFQEKVTVIKLGDTTKKKKRPTYKDTVIVVRKALTKEQLKEREEKRIREQLKKNNFCECVKMDVNAPEILKRGTYLNYDVIFKNDCEIDVWISTKHFRSRPENSFGKPVKELRKLSFVKKFGMPDFVNVKPGESYAFKMSDDVFFQYDLNKGEAYTFYFEHRNFGDRSKDAPGKTYLCGQKRTKLIVVR